MKKVIDINKLDFQYGNQPEVLTDISLQLRTGKIHGLLGKKGEGKSTLLKIICGLVFPKTGELKILGFDPRKRNRLMLQDIFFLPEELNSSNLSVESFEKVYAPFYPDYNSSDYYKNLNELLIDTKTQNINKLPFGQKKKFYIAFALATNAKIILFDEPTAGLDLPSISLFHKLIASSVSNNSCILISTQQVADLDDVLDDIIIMQKHKIVLHETRENISSRLTFSTSTRINTEEETIYSEETPDGFVHIGKNSSGKSGGINIELLFNAITNNNNRIIETIKQE